MLGQAPVEVTMENPTQLESALGNRKVSEPQPAGFLEQVLEIRRARRLGGDIPLSLGRAAAKRGLYSASFSSYRTRAAGVIRPVVENRLIYRWNSVFFRLIT